MKTYPPDIRLMGLRDLKHMYSHPPDIFLMGLRDLKHMYSHRLPGLERDFETHIDILLLV
jgi:hypothetical protein